MTKSKYPPILFNTEMVQAILDNRKKQTRRLIKDPYVQERLESGDHDRTYIEKNVPYKIGDILWVRETFWFDILAQEYEYKADEKPYMKLFTGWKPSIHMPKTAARIFLKVKNVRWERIQDISEADAIGEGLQVLPQTEWESRNFDETWYKDYLDKKNFWRVAKMSFRSLWQKINSKDSWKQNPYVWVYDFEQVEKPADF